MTPDEVLSPAADAFPLVRFAQSITDLPRPPRETVLGYLGHAGQEVTDELQRRMEEAQEACVNLARPSYVMLLDSIKRSDDAIGLGHAELTLGGKSIARHLDGAVGVGILVVTLGHPIERSLRALGSTDATGQVLLDACATTLVEAAADWVEDRIRSLAGELGLFCNWRYSPGYGDFPLAVQPRILAATDAMRRIGVTSTSTHLLIPTKSVTAVMGLFAAPRDTKGTLCPACQLFDSCSYRLSGRTCHDPA